MDENRPDQAKTYTVQLGFYDHFAHTAVVTARSIEEACERAVKEADGQSSWKSTAHATTTYVDAIAEGDDVNPWSADARSALPIPPRFRDTAAVGSVASARANELTWLLRELIASAAQFANR